MKKNFYSILFFQLNDIVNLTKSLLKGARSEWKVKILYEREKFIKTFIGMYFKCIIEK